MVNEKRKQAFLEAIKRFSFEKDTEFAVEDATGSVSSIDLSDNDDFTKKFKVVLSKFPEFDYIKATMHCHFNEDDTISDFYVIEHKMGKRIGHYDAAKEIEINGIKNPNNYPKLSF